MKLISFHQIHCCEIWAAVWRVRDSTTAKVEISKTETHAVSEFAPIYVAGAGVPRLEQTKPKLNRTEQGIMNLETLKKLCVNEFRFKLTCGIAALTLAISAAAQAGSVPIRGGSQPFAITMGEDGAFWFTLSNSNRVARILPNGSISYSTTPTLSNPAFITPGPDGNIWFGEGSTGKIASVTPNGVITEYQFSFFGVSVGITTGSDGNIWFTDQTDHAVWRFEIATGTFTEFPTPTPNSFPGDITTGSDGNMWFTEQAVDKFGRITPDGVITEFTGLSAPGSIAAGPDGNLWIASAFTPEIARVTPTLDITIFPTPSTPTIIRPGNRNNLLFTEFSANKIASITTDGVVTESQEFPHSAPVGITAGVASRVWFLGTGTNRVYETHVPR